MSVHVEAASTTDLEALSDAWVALAAEQRQYGSHLSAAANRDRIRESMAHHVVEGTCLVARPTSPGDDEGSSSPGEDATESNATGQSEASDQSDESGQSRFVGFVTFSVDDDGYGRDVRRGTVENLYVDADHRGRGVGGALLSAAESALADRGVEVASLEVLAGNVRARGFYDDAGYDEHRLVLEKRVDVETDTKGNAGE